MAIGSVLATFFLFNYYSIPSSLIIDRFIEQQTLTITYCNGYSNAMFNVHVWVGYRFNSMCVLQRFRGAGGPGVGVGWSGVGGRAEVRVMFYVPSRVRIHSVFILLTISLHFCRCRSFFFFFLCVPSSVLGFGFFHNLFRNIAFYPHNCFFFSFFSMQFFPLHIHICIVYPICTFMVITKE